MEKPIHLYSDASYFHHNKKAGYAFMKVQNKVILDRRWGALKGISNAWKHKATFLEFYVMLMALNTLKDGESVIVHTDVSGFEGVLRKGKLPIVSEVKDELERTNSQIVYEPAASRHGYYGWCHEHAQKGSRQ